MALSKEQGQKIAIGFVLAATFVYVYINYLLNPTRQHIAQTQSELTAVVGRVDALKITASRLPELRQQTTELDAQVAKVEKRLPRTKNLEDIIRTVTELAKKSGLSFSAFTPSGESPQTYYTEIPFNLAITGSFHALGKFLAAIGQQERIFSAKNLQLNFVPNTKKGYTVQGNFTLLAFVYNG